MKSFRVLLVAAGLACVALPLALLSRGGERARPRAPRVVSSGGYPVRIATVDGGELVLDAPPRRVVPANAGAVDTVTLFVGPERLAGLPEAAFEFSRLARAPEPWERLPRFAGYDAETLLELAPDLIVADGWQRVETTALLRSSGVPVLVCPLPETWEDVLASLRVVGAALGSGERAAALEEELAPRLDALRARSRALGDVSALSYSNLGTGGWVAGAGTTADILFELAHVQNAAARHGVRGFEEADFERLVALAPDVIVVGAGRLDPKVAPTADFLRNDRVTRELPAVRAGRIVALPPELFTSSSLELVTGAERLLDALEELPQRGTDG
jgi:ABC-type Fe3+-hydroxamate transport system substrate-binding protein